jgi:anti-sigma factor RsiW
MKESKFIELLNLYVDHEITAADAALLEAEIERSPERRHVYRQYCQLQKGCTVLAHEFRANETPETANVIQFPVRRRVSPAWGYAAGLVAAAACVAFVFVGRNAGSVQEPGRGATVVASQPAMQPVAKSEFAAAAKVQPAASTLAARPALQPVFTGLTATPAEGEAGLTLAENSQFDWMNRVQLQRVRAEDLRFDSREDFKQPDIRTDRARQSFKAHVEMTAFQFQR